MKNAMVAGVLFGSLLMLAACTVRATKEAPAGVKANVAMAQAVAQALVNRDFDAAREDFGVGMRSALSKEKLEEAWNQYSGNKGAFKRFGETYVEYVKLAPCVFVPCHFEEDEVVVQVTQDVEGTVVTGLFLRPSGFSFL